VARGGQNRKAKPAKVLQGTFRPDRDGAKPAVGTQDSKEKRRKFPSCPEWLSEAARMEWRRLAPGLADRVETLDRAAFAAYCDAYARWKDATESLGRHGSQFYELPNGCPAVRPELKAIAQALREMKAYAEALGLTPLARTRVPSSAPKDPQGDPWDNI
jgi:P27 family predicted phage terminase small subunit